MKIVTRILLGLALSGLLMAQDKAQKSTSEEASKSVKEDREKRVFQVKYADVRELRNVLGVFGYGIQADPDLHVIAISAPHDVILAVENAIQRLDVPSAAPKDIDLVVYMIVASEHADGTHTLPAEMEPVAKELQSVFNYKSFRMLDTILLRTQPGNNAHAKGVIADVGGIKTPYEFVARPNAVTEDPKGRLIRLDNLSLNLHVGGGNDAGINTDITVREGQKVVVGKSNMGGPDQALILVVTAKVTE